MIRGDLSGMWRGGTRPKSSRGDSSGTGRGSNNRATSTRGASSRGPWRGNRGNWRGGKNSFPRKEDAKLLPPLGRLVTEFKLEDISRSVQSTEEIRIANCGYAASYSLTDEKPSKIIVPGKPAVWTPHPLPHGVPPDTGTYVRDQNGARFPDHPIQLAVQALFALDERFDPSSVDITGCASSVGDVLRFVRSVDSTFRFDVELVGNTLFLVRNCKNDVIPDVQGYGHSFLDTFTSFGQDDGKVKSHQRIISYDLAHLKCVIRFECDGYMAEWDNQSTVLRKPVINLPKLKEPDSINMEEKGMVVPQDSVLEIKTRAATRGDVEKAEHLPRLWLRQIPFFINGYHSQGKFVDVRVQNVREDITKWETEHQDEIKRLASVLRQLITEVKKANHLKLELCREGSGPLQLREREGTTNKALTDSWERRWIAKPGSEDGSDGDEGDKAYPSARTSSDLSDDSRASFSFDYTECSVECGYCGNCG